MLELPLDARRIRCGLAGGLFLADPPCRFSHVVDRLGDTRVRVICRAGSARCGSVSGAVSGGGGLWLVFGRPRLAGVDGGLALSLDSLLDSGRVHFEPVPPLRGV